MTTTHYPVMLSNVLKQIKSLSIHRKFSIADCNFGLGGHSNAILNAFPNSNITAFDLDQSIIDVYKSSKPLQTADQSRLQIRNQNFTQILKQNAKFDVILADLGFNSLQLQEYDGFSWNKDTPLDMQYEKGKRSCSSLIDELSFIQTVDILIKYGDLNLSEAKLAAKSIQQARPIKTTFQLRDSVVGCFQSNKTRKLAQIFQAFRIATNNQLESLRLLCSNMHKVLNPNALVLLITFHSLERDIIMQQVRSQKKHFSKAKIEKPNESEMEENSRSKSAQMIIFKKIE